MGMIDSSTVILVTSDGMGDAEEPLRHRLLHTYLGLLADNGLVPAAICFYANGVRMAVEGSPVLDPLRKLEEQGAHLILCSTCLNYLGLMDEVQVGIVGGMTDIVEAQGRAGKVITI
jgi:hypothetical protein